MSAVSTRILWSVGEYNAITGAAINGFSITGTYDFFRNAEFNKMRPRGSHPTAASRRRHEELPFAVGRKGEASINVLAGKLRKIL